MKNTALTDIHVKLGAKMIPFAGYNMPVQYEGLKAEHHNVRENVGVFDVSHMGEFLVSGNQALAFLQKVTSNDVAKLTDGKVQYSCFPNEKGGIVDDLLVYRFNEKEYMLVVNASNIEKDWNWLETHKQEGVTLTDRSDDISLLAIQGPKAAETLQSLTEVKLEELTYYTFVRAELAGIPNAIISATGYTGAGGFEIYVENQYAEKLWNEVFKAGEPYSIKPAGLGARDTLRLEMGFCLYGNDIEDTTSPLEAGLGWITKFNKDFINSDNLKKQKEEGISRRLVGFEMHERGIPRQGYVIKNDKGKEIGRVTSGTQSPSLNKAIGMGYVEVACKDPGTRISIEIRNKAVAAEVVKLPFYKK